MGDFDGHKLQSLTKDGLKFSDEDEAVQNKRNKAYRKSFQPLTKYMKELLRGKVAKIAVSQRVEESPSVIVTSQYGHSANMERIIRAQTFSNPEQYNQMKAMKTLELNPRHPIIIELNKLIKSDPTSDSTRDLAFLVYDTALLASGFHHDDAESFATRMHRTIASSLNLNSMDLVPEVAFDEEEDEDDASSAPAVPTMQEEEENLDDGAHDEF